MTATKKTLCLNMIVKNESAIIRDTLDNILNHLSIDYYVISDTGSTDNTIEEIQQFFQEKGINGEIYQDSWVNFAHNRNLALEYAKNKTDYVLIFDADDRFVGDFSLPAVLTADRYALRMGNDAQGSNIYFRPLILRNDGTFYWRGALHEFIDQQGHMQEARILGNYLVVSGRFGARSNNPQKYLEDAQILEKAFYAPEDEDLKPRYAFYLAQSYRDAGMTEQALAWYQKRVELGNWVEEVYCSLLQIAFLKDSLNAPLEEVQAAFLKAYEYRPERAESLYHLARYLRFHDRIKLAYIYALAAVSIPLNEDKLFVNYSVYDWRAKDELSVSAYWVGNYQMCFDLCVALLANPNVPTVDKERLQQNLNYAAEKLGKKIVVTENT